MEAATKSSVRIYELYPIKKILELKGQIQEAIFGKSNDIDNQNKVFVISKSSGWLNYTDYSAIWSSRDGTLLAENKLEAIRVAEDFMDAANGKIAQINKEQNAGLPSIFPAKSQRQIKESYAVKHRDGHWTDHWVCAYEISVSSYGTSQNRAFVYGTGLEIRVGKNNAIIGFSSRWRPFSKTIYTDLSPIEEAETGSDAAGDGHHGTDAGAPSDQATERKIAYLFEGDGASQYYLAPYYYFFNGHHIVFLPASKYSLVVSISQEESENETKILAKVAGGSGNYKYNWAYWNNNSAWQNDSELIEIGSGSSEVVRENNKLKIMNSVRLPKGVYNVLLNVVDVKTSAFKNIQQMIYSQVTNNDNA